MIIAHLNSACRRFTATSLLWQQSPNISLSGSCNSIKKSTQRTFACHNIILSSKMSTASISKEDFAPIIHPTIESIRSVRKSFDASLSVGFVPTMGALHEGIVHKKYSLQCTRHIKLMVSINIHSSFSNDSFTSFQDISH